MTLMLESSKEDNLVPFLVSLTKLASRSTHLASELVCSFFAFFLHILTKIKHYPQYVALSEINFVDNEFLY